MLSQQIKNSGSLLDSIDAVRNWRAVGLLLITLVAAALVMGLGMLLSSVSFAFVALFALAAYAVVFYGANAVGVMVMDEARGSTSRPMMAAVLNSLGTSHRLILVFLLIGVLYMVGFLALALILLICKIPFLGPVLYTFVFPVSAVIVGIALFAVPTVVFPLSAPSIWNGATTMQCVSQLLAIARKRLIMVLILMIAVAFIAGVVGVLIGAILLTGSLTTAGLSAGILGGGMGGLGGMMGGMMGGGMGGMGMAGMGMEALGGHAIAGAIGGGILYAAAFTLPGLVYLRGASTVYLRAIDGLDLASEQAAMDGKIAAARAKARDLQAQAQASAQKYAQQATAKAEPVAPPAPAPTPTSTPAPVAPADVFTPAPAQTPQAYTPPPAMPAPAPVTAAASVVAAAPFTPAAPPVAPPTQPDVALPAVVPTTGPVSAGSPMAPKCPKCGASIEPGDAFCGECGNDLR